MKTKVKYYFTLLSLLLVLVCFNLFPFGTITAKAAKSETFSSGVTLMSASIISEEVNYTRREEIYIETTNAVPLYTALASSPNVCGPVAGAIVVGFYDKYYDNLIPNYTGYYPATGKYKNTNSTYVTSLMDELYVLMRTNIDDVGVSESDCVNGLMEYVRNKNYSVNMTSIKKNSAFSMADYNCSIESNKPVLLFSTVANYYIVTTSGNTDYISQGTVEGNHVYVGFGYYIINYFNGDSIFRTDTYVRAASGLAGNSSLLLRISSTVATDGAADWFVNGYTVSIS